MLSPRSQACWEEVSWERGSSSEERRDGRKKLEMRETREFMARLAERLKYKG
jgi:hypothetical protein